MKGLISNHKVNLSVTIKCARNTRLYTSYLTHCPFVDRSLSATQLYVHLSLSLPLNLTCISLIIKSNLSCYEFELIINSMLSQPILPKDCLFQVNLVYFETITSHQHELVGDLAHLNPTKYAWHTFGQPQPLTL